MTDRDSQHWYSPQQVADALGTTPETVRAWCADGTLPAVAVGSGRRRRHWRIAPGWADVLVERSRPTPATRANGRRRRRTERDLLKFY